MLTTLRLSTGSSCGAFAKCIDGPSTRRCSNRVGKSESVEQTCPVGQGRCRQPAVRIPGGSYLGSVAIAVGADSFDDAPDTFVSQVAVVGGWPASASLDSSIGIDVLELTR